jgi:hypothetical protein
MRMIRVLDLDTATYEECELVEAKKDKRGVFKYVEVFRNGAVERFERKAGLSFEKDGKIIMVRQGDLEGVR